MTRVWMPIVFAVTVLALMAACWWWMQQDGTREPRSEPSAPSELDSSHQSGPPPSRVDSDLSRPASDEPGPALEAQSAPRTEIQPGSAATSDSPRTRRETHEQPEDVETLSVDDEVSREELARVERFLTAFAEDSFDFGDPEDGLFTRRGLAAEMSQLDSDLRVVQDTSPDPLLQLHAMLLRGDVFWAFGEKHIAVPPPSDAEAADVERFLAVMRSAGRDDIEHAIGLYKDAVEFAVQNGLESEGVRRARERSSLGHPGLR